MLVMFGFKLHRIKPWPISAFKYFGHTRVHVMGDEYNLTRNQAQSALWYYEQDLYRRVG